MHRFLCTLIRAVLAALPLATAVAAGAQQASPTMSLDEIERGQRGFGLSVFAGSEPERFEVEVLGVMRNSAPDQSFILVRLSGQGLEQTGVIAGMSGSPVYIDERLVGAVAFSWPFSQGAVGGITPIDSMLALSTVEVPAAISAVGDLPTLPSELRQAELDAGLLRRQLELLSPGMPGEARSGLLWSLSGFGPHSRSFVEEALTGAAMSVAAPAGEASPGVSSELEPGSAVAGVLVNGDLKLAVTGTVTERIEDEIFAFGHAFLGQGPVRLPMASAEVVTVLSSQLVSFKISNVGRVVGTFDLDRSSGVRGRLGTMSPTIPMTISLAGLGQAAFEMELADVPVYLPVLVAISSLGALDSTSRSAGAQGIDLAVRWELDRYPAVELAQSFDGPSAGLSAATYLFLMTNYLINNPLEEVRLRGVSVELTQHPEPRTVRILRGFANRATVEPGDHVEVTLELQPFRGSTYKESFTVELPRELPPGVYSLIVGDGVTMDGVRQQVEQVTPETFEQSIDMVRGFHSNRDLVTLGLAPAWGLSLSGHVLPRLPSSMRGLWQHVAPGGARQLGLAVLQRIETRVEQPMSGGVRIDVRVEPPHRMSPGVRNEKEQR